jgi:drug/metabolite transporter (DMT)-like permease
LSLPILLILLLSALGHATWNAIARRVDDRDSFFTLIMGVSVLLYLPLAVYLWRTEPFPAEAWKWVAASTVFEVLYFAALAKAYRLASLSTAYPIVRGTAPVGTALLALVFFHSTLSAFGMLGILLIVLGILFVNQSRFSPRAVFHSIRNEPQGVLWAFLAGLCTACYNVSDGLGAALMSGILFKYVVFIGMFLGKAALNARRPHRTSYRELLRRHPWATLIAGLLVFGANSAAVYAMQSTSVAYVASVREIAIVFAALIGMIWLKEKISLVKWISILLIVAGVLVIKLH